MMISRNMDSRIPFIRTGGLEPWEKPIREALDAISRQEIVRRIWAKDWTVWDSDPAEIANRLGWLFSPAAMAERLPALEAFARSVANEGYTDVLLMGMGGSSLAPEVFSRVFPAKKGFLNLHILDSTAPDAVLEFDRDLDPATTLYIVSSKSGTTAETAAFLNYFFVRASGRLGEDKAGAHFCAITDPGSPLESLGRRLGFRAVFEGDPEIGGRFSALSPFGLVPAALMGIDLNKMLAKARGMARLCRENEAAGNPGVFLGAILGVLAGAGRDKLTLILPPRLHSLAAWIEQLIAESTGKRGKGILPVTGFWGPGQEADESRADRILAEVCMGSTPVESPEDRAPRMMIPSVRLVLEEEEALGAHFFLWEMATAVVGFVLGINPFDQPNVELAKKKTREILKAGFEAPAGAPPAADFGDIRIHSDILGPSVEESLRLFLKQARPGDYVSLQAFIAPSRDARNSLLALQSAVQERTKLAVTGDFGPRYLHSTGQLHKGDRGNGLFIQIAEEPGRDVPIPGIPGWPAPAASFGTLIAAQARGDWMALRETSRRVLRLEMGKNAAAKMKDIASRL